MDYHSLPTNESLIDKLKKSTIIRVWHRKNSSPFLFLNLGKARLHTWDLKNSCDISLDYHKTHTNRLVCTGTLLKCPIVLELAMDEMKITGTFKFGSLVWDVYVRNEDDVLAHHTC